MSSVNIFRLPAKRNLSIPSPITVAVDSEGLAEGACQVEEDHTPEHHLQVVVACRGEVVAERASRDEAAPEDPLPSDQEEEAPWDAVQTVAEQGKAEAEHRRAWERIARAASAAEVPSPWEAGPGRGTPASGPAGASPAAERRGKTPAAR